MRLRMPESTTRLCTVLANGVQGGNGVYHADITPAHRQLPQRDQQPVSQLLGRCRFQPQCLRDREHFRGQFGSCHESSERQRSRHHLRRPAWSWAPNSAATWRARSPACRFYKGSLDTGVHTGQLWSSARANCMATATFSNETASGWQQGFHSRIPSRSQPIADVHRGVPHHRRLYRLYPGRIASSGISNGVLHAAGQRCRTGPNGVYHYDVVAAGRRRSPR